MRTLHFNNIFILSASCFIHKSKSGAIYKYRIINEYLSLYREYYDTIKQIYPGATIKLLGDDYFLIRKIHNIKGIVLNDYIHNKLEKYDINAGNCMTCGKLFFIYDEDVILDIKPYIKQISEITIKQIDLRISKKITTTRRIYFDKLIEQLESDNTN